MVSAPRATLVELGVAQTALEQACGDAYAIHETTGGVLLAVVDGVGHGAEAAEAAALAITAIAEHREAAPTHMIAALDEALRGSRGAVASLAWVYEAGTVTWLGVGNVEGVIVGLAPGQPVHRLVMRNGTLGYRVPMTRAVSVAVLPGDTLVLATDGVDPGELSLVDPSQPAQGNADRILAGGARGVDDALVLVARLRPRTR